MATFKRGHSAQHQLERNRKAIEKIDHHLHQHTTVHVHSTFEFPNPVDVRGIPAVGRGVTGAIRGTRPDTAIDHRADATP